MASAELQQPTAAHAHEVGEHGQLVVREETRLDVAEYDRRVLVEFGARLGEARDEFVAVVHVEADELAVRRPLQDHELNVRIQLDGFANEAHFVPRRAFDVEHLLACVTHLHQRALRIVLHHLFAILHRNSERQRARTRLRQLCRDPHRRSIRSGRHQDVGAGHNAPFVFHDQWDRFAVEPTLPNEHVGDERAVLQHAARRFNALHLDVA